MLYKSLFILVSVGFFACTTAKKTIDSSPKTQQPMVLTVLLKFKPTKKGRRSKIELVNIIKAAGHAKELADSPANYEFRFVDKDGHRIAAQFKAISLTPVLEYVNDKGDLDKKKVEGENVIVSIRTNYSPEMKELVIYQMVKENFEPIASFELN